LIGGSVGGLSQIGLISPLGDKCLDARGRPHEGFKFLILGFRRPSRLSGKSDAKRTIMGAMVRMIYKIRQ